MRLQVYLSRNGVSSRRQALEIIQEGRVTVNGKVCREPSTPVDSGDRISVDAKTVRDKTFTYILLNKPSGFTTSKMDRYAKRLVYDLLPAKFRHLSPVGRLDRDTEGLLLLSNDGDTAYRLTHPKFNVNKVYFVRLAGRLTKEKQAKLEKGVYLDGRRTAPAQIRSVRLFKEQTELKITIHEGRKRQVRRMFAAAGYKVVYLKRLVQGPLTLAGLKTGQWRLLTVQEIEALRAIPG